MQTVELFTIPKDPGQTSRKLKSIIAAGNTIVSFSLDTDTSNSLNYLTVVAERSDPNAKFKNLSAGGR